MIRIGAFTRKKKGRKELGVNMEVKYNELVKDAGKTEQEASK